MMNTQHATDELIRSAIARRVSAVAEGDLRERILAATASHRQRQGWRVRLGGGAEWLLPQRGLALRLSVVLVLLVTVAFVAVLVGFRPFDSTNPPRLGALAYLSGGDLYVAGPGGESPRRVWDLPEIGNGGGSGLAWLDAETLLLNAGTPLAVGTQLPEGAYVVGVTTGAHPMLIPGWYSALSPDRRTVLVSTFDEHATPQASTRLIEIASGATLKVIPETGGVGDAVFSPDGRSMVGATSETIDRFDVASGEHTILVTGLCCGLSAHTPTWSPDGSRVVYVNYHNPDAIEDCGFRCGTLWSVPAAGGEPTRITAEPGSEVSPAFSPDGRWIAYIDQCPGSYANLTIMATDGSGTRVLARDQRLPPVIDSDGSQMIPGCPRDPFSWDPDSAGITYVTTAATLWHVTLDGTATQLEGSAITGFARQVLP